MMRIKVDLPPPEAPIRQMNSPLLMTRLRIPQRVDALTVKLEFLRDVFDFQQFERRCGHLLNWGLQRRSRLLTQVIALSDRKPATPMTIMPQITRSVRDRVRASMITSTQPLRHAGFISPHHDHDPGEAEAEPQAGEDTGQGGGQNHAAEDIGAFAAQHRGGFEQLGIDGPHTEDSVE